MPNIDVTVIIPTFRREREVVEAVRSAIAQDGVTVEAIVLDDSEDGSAREAIRQIGDERVRYIKRAVPSRGRPAIARNEGAKLARGRYVHFLDDDDRLAQGALAAMVDALDARPGAGIALGWVVPFGDDPATLQEKRDYFERAARIGASTRSTLGTVATILFRGTLMVNSACMIRRQHIDALGGYDASMPVYEDVDFFTRGIRRFGHVYVDRPVLHYRTGAPSLMHNLKGDNAKVVESYAIMYRKYKREHGLLEFTALRGLAKVLAP
jgi:glycosyltransferase involved in cell wall biosynthesis